MQDSEETSSSLDNVIYLKIKRNLKEAKHVESLKRNFHSSTEPEEKLFKQFQVAYQLLQNHLQDEKSIGRTIMETFGWKEEATLKDLIKVEGQIALRNVLDSWAFWLDEANLKFENNLGKADISAFISRIHQAISNNCHASLIDRSAHKIQLAKAIMNTEKRAVWGKSKDLLSEVINRDVYFGTIAKYYMVHYLIKTKNPRTRADCLETFELLSQARRGVEERMRNQGELNSAVGVIARHYGEQQASFVFVNEFEVQRRDIIDLLNIFINSLDQMLGVELATELLETDVIDPLVASRIMKALHEADLLTKARVVNADVERLREKYELYFPEIKRTVKNLEGETISPEDLKHLLPGREHFWQQLVESELIQDEKKFVVVDCDALKEKLKTKSGWEAVEKMLKDLVESDDGSHFKDVWHDEGNNDNTQTPKRVCQAKEKIKVCLYPEHLKDIMEPSKNTKVMLIKTFEEKHGDMGLWKSLIRQDIIMTNSVGTLEVSGSGVRQRSIGSFDGLGKDTFADIRGVNKALSARIFDKLVQLEVLATSGDRIILDGEKLQSVEFPNEHGQFETEVKNYISKSFHYSESLTRIQQKGATTLPCNPHEDLWADLVANNNVEPSKLDPSIKDADGRVETCVREAAEREGKGWYKFRKFVKTVDDAVGKPLPGGISDGLPDKEEDRNEEIVRELVGTVCSARSGLAKLDAPDSSLKPLREYVKPMERHAKSVEMECFSSNSNAEVIVLSEARWTRSTIAGIVGVLILGLFEIAIGLLITLGSIGGGTFVGAAFISEGIGDIWFALECAWSGYFSWKSYLLHKAVSLVFTVLTCGVAAWLSRGAKFSKFGYKLGKEYGKKLAGWALIKEFGKVAVVKQLAYEFGKKLLKTGALFAGSRLAKWAAGYFQRMMVDKICKQALSNVEFQELTDEVKALCEKVGTDKAEEILRKITEKVFGSKGEIEEQLDEILGYLRQSRNALMEALGSSMEKTGDNEAAQMLTIITYISKAVDVTGSAGEVLTFVTKMKKKLKKEILSLQQNSCRMQVQIAHQPKQP